MPSSRTLALKSEDFLSLSKKTGHNARVQALPVQATVGSMRAGHRYWTLALV